MLSKSLTINGIIYAVKNQAVEALSVELQKEFIIQFNGVDCNSVSELIKQFKVDFSSEGKFTKKEKSKALAALQKLPFEIRAKILVEADPDWDTESVVEKEFKTAGWINSRLEKDSDLIWSLTMERTIREDNSYDVSFLGDNLVDFEEIAKNYGQISIKPALKFISRILKAVEDYKIAEKLLETGLISYRPTQHFTGVAISDKNAEKPVLSALEGIDYLTKVLIPLRVKDIKLPTE